MDVTVGQADRRRRLIRNGATLWEIFEHTPDYDRRARPTLVFMSDDVVRRVRDFPADWFTLGDAELLRLSLGR